MKQRQKRGRKSAAELSVVPKIDVVERIERPAPPEELTQEEAQEWHDVVDARAADWYDAGVRASLIQYCRHTVRARQIATLIRDCRGTDSFLDLVAKEIALTRVILSVATKLRLTPQSTTNHRGNKTIEQDKPPPWVDH